MTGAVLPHGCDCVVPFERAEVGNGQATLSSEAEVAPGRNVHRRASDGRQGDLLLKTGTVLRAPEIAVAASAGMSRVRVSSQPAVMVVSTGNELIEPGEPILDHQVRRSNAYAVAAMLRQRGFSRVADDHLPDDPRAAALAPAAAPGHARRVDHERRRVDGALRLRARGAGRARRAPRCFIVSPSGPASRCGSASSKAARPCSHCPGIRSRLWYAWCATSCRRCTRRWACSRSAWSASRSAEPVELTVPLASFVPVEVDYDEWARPWARPRTLNTSGDFSTLAGTDGFVELPPGPNSFPKGFVTRLYRW